MKLHKLAAFALSIVAGAAFAQGYPSKPIRLLVPFAPGGTSDLMARAMQEPMQKLLGQPIVVENKTGAGGAIAAREVVRAPTDGYTLLFTYNGLNCIVPVISKNPGFDPVKDFAPVSLVSTAPQLLIVNPELPVNNVAGLIEYARAHPGALEYATSGVGSSSHLSAELFSRLTGVKLLHVPFKGQAESTSAVMKGEAKLVFNTGSSALNAFVTSGRLKILGVSTRQPSPLAPGIPTIGTTVPGFEAELWFGVLAPAGTSPAVVETLQQAIEKTLAGKDLQQRFVNFGVTAKASTPKELNDMIVTELARWTKVVKDAGITAE